ncbi:hypothetical protein [Arenibaculum pallidiluteum]|uniref:hypothetical protein n=1 Tax=Arenibaculum pallidiluteum TaxID=2812559 RepID=UPI001A964973|nr:hypothetical protein [Arenibaculum pallidiluteum]
MLKLGARVLVKGREGMVVARTHADDTLYDVRFPDGSMTTYLPLAEIDASGPGAIREGGAAAGP